MVEEADAIVHVASPAELQLGHPDSIIRPAVNAITSLLKSVISHGSSVKRIVYTSTGAAVFSPSSGPKTFNESDWNDFAVQHCQEKGADASPYFKYCASKVLAERTAWEIYEQHKVEKKWDFVSLIPPWVFGPVIHAVSTPESLNFSMLEWYQTVFMATTTEDEQIEDGYVCNCP